MERVITWILKHKNIIVIIFTIAVIISAFTSQLVKVNYDMNDYLPEESSSSVALDVMDENFDSEIPNARVMVSNVTINEALLYKEQFQALEGVTDVIWLDDVISLYEPLSMQDNTIVDNYYIDEQALFTVTINDSLRVETVNQLRDIIGDNGAMTGAAVNTAIATESTVVEIPKIIMFSVPIIIFILILTTSSWIEPIIIMVSIGIAILLNMGSNLLFGEVSFVTDGAGSILQLAVSLDYSVFLLHRFEEMRGKGMESEEAMFEALKGSITSILSSGLTTVIGFAALILMRFGIGPDLGMALAKGIFISLLIVFTLLPVITLYTYELMEKTHHKPLLPSFDKFGKLVSKQMIPMVVLFIILIVPGYMSQQSNDFYYGSEHIFGQDTRLGQDTTLINDVFGKSNPMVLLVPKGNTSNELSLSNQLEEIPQVSEVISYNDSVGTVVPTAFIPEDILDELESQDYRRFIINISTQYEGDDAFATVEMIREIAENLYPESWYLAGESVSTYDLMDTIIADNVTVNLIAIAAVFIVLMLSFKSLAIPIILVLSIETAIWINLSLPYYSGTTLFYLTYLIISSIQLGATVDYAILTTSKYMELRSTKYKKEAVVETISSVTTSILTSGLSLTVVGFLLGGITSHGILKQLGTLLGSGALLSMIIVFFVLPGLLYSFDGLIELTTKNCQFIHENKPRRFNIREDLLYAKK